MKFLLVAVSLIGSALAQNIHIGAPANGSSIQVGKQFTVEVDRPNSLTGTQEVAIVIGLNACYSSTDCVPASEAIGSVLYSGPYDPQYTSDAGTTTKPPHQNFTVTVPDYIQTGRAILSVSHLSLVGAGPWPMFEVVNSSVVITSS
ncbi:hypothetical protein OE88DRAFT_1627754 [Heliocybe sulcata]|uniref:Uncharacterized protein n=1 Tax=Heliocybe sulcata TaxID=5364 RepID=A0A5C3N6H6_9AGAM|nr:hypothetical protein OE88DRAFT_1627754 [Heliocybe sulcata]